MDYVDKNMQQALNDFCLKEYGAGFALATTYQCKDLERTFGSIRLDAFTISDLLALDRSTLKSRAVCYKFVLYLYETHLLQNEDGFDKLPCFRTEFQSVCAKESLTILYRIPIFREYVKKYGTNWDKKKLKVYKAEPYSVDFKDPELRELAIKFANYEIKLCDDYSDDLKLTLLLSFSHLCTHYLSKITLQDFSLESIINFRDVIFHLNKTPNPTRSLNRFISFMEAEGKISDDKLHYLGTYGKVEKIGLSEDDYVRLSETPVNSDNVKITMPGGKIISATISAESDEIRNSLKEFALSFNTNSTALTIFLSEFAASSSKSICTYSDLTLQTYLAQVKYYKNNKQAAALVTSYYLYVVQNLYPQLWDKEIVGPQILQRKGIQTEINDGFCIITYTPYEREPGVDKWILCYSNAYVSNQNIRASETVEADFTQIADETYRTWAKKYIWFGCKDVVSGIVHALPCLTNFLNTVSDYIAQTPGPAGVAKRTIPSTAINAYLTTRRSQKVSKKTMAHEMYHIRSLLQYLQQQEIISVSTAIMLQLKAKKTSNNIGDAEAIPNDDLIKIGKVINKKASESDLWAIYRLVFYFGLETAFRISQILAFNYDCLKETQKRDEYVIVSKTKTSDGAPVEQAVTLETARNVQEIVKLTSRYRNETTITNNKEYLFLKPTLRQGAYRLISSTDFNKFLQQCCKEAGTKSYSFANLRDTHITRALEMQTRGVLSVQEESVVTGHRDPNSDRYYDGTTVNEVMSIIYKINIGDVDIAGNILSEVPEGIDKNRNSVESGGGICGLQNCIDHSILSCYICSHCIFTVDRMPYIKEQIAELDTKLEASETDEETKNLQDIKRLLVTILAKLEEKQLEVNNGKS